MSRDFVGALLQLNAEKGVSREQLVETVEEAIESAYRRVAPGNEDVGVEIDPETGRIRVYRARTVVDEVEDPMTQFTLDEARRFRQDAQVGDLVEYEQVDPSNFGRIHAQTAKQVVLQRLREAEREVVFGQYASREGELITGTVSRVEPRAIILDVGRGVEAILATTEQSATEHYRIGQHVKAYVLEVRRTTKGPQIFVSRTHKGFLRRLFELEVPEIHAGLVEIKAIAREAGSRSKVAVASRQEGLDPVGASVGQRGGRVQAVVAELSGEKIDVIPWADDPAQMVANALSPAQVVNVVIDEENRIANVEVPERMLSLAIGREGQNARLAAKLTGWRIDIRSDVAVASGTAPPPPPRRIGPQPGSSAGRGPTPAPAAQPVMEQAAAAPSADGAPAPSAEEATAPSAEEAKAPSAEGPAAPIVEAEAGPAMQPETEPLAAPAEPAPKAAVRARRVPAATEPQSDAVTELIPADSSEPAVAAEADQRPTDGASAAETPRKKRAAAGTATTRAKAATPRKAIPPKATPRKAIPPKATSEPSAAAKPSRARAAKAGTRKATGPAAMAGADGRASTGAADAAGVTADDSSAQEVAP
jgi:N utilization substance protein A